MSKPRMDFCSTPAGSFPSIALESKASPPPFGVQTPSTNQSQPANLSESCSRASAAMRPTSLSLPLITAHMLLLLLPGAAFELQDTIHELIEENIHLHDQLENLTQALGKLRRMLWHHSNDPTHHEHHKEDIHHLWEEWSQRGLSADTHLLLEHTFCGRDLHGSAGPRPGGPSLVLMTMMATTAAYLSSLMQSTIIND
ncbi:uncharacterized protein LOC144001960 [Festucalex cinctus]